MKKPNNALTDGPVNMMKLLSVLAQNLRSTNVSTKHYRVNSMAKRLYKPASVQTDETIIDDANDMVYEVESF